VDIDPMSLEEVTEKGMGIVGMKQECHKLNPVIKAKNTFLPPLHSRG
jgi:hypothetical protein